MNYEDSTSDSSWLVFKINPPWLAEKYFFDRKILCFSWRKDVFQRNSCGRVASRSYFILKNGELSSTWISQGRRTGRFVLSVISGVRNHRTMIHVHMAEYINVEGLPSTVERRPSCRPDALIHECPEVDCCCKIVPRTSYEFATAGLPWCSRLQKQMYPIPR